MRWRCTWCGKPHEENDPPCDNCGHARFEEAIVRQTDLSEGNEREAALVWVCTDCGREHPKHAPPCSRCGNTTLEKQRQHVDEAELTPPGYRDLVTPQYLAVLGVVLAFAVIVTLGLTGIVDLPGFDQGGVPEVDGVPGNDSTANGISLAEVEQVYLTALNDELAGDEQLERHDDLDEIATFYNQQILRWQLADGSEPDAETTAELLAEVCHTDEPITFQDVSVQFTDGDDPTALGDALARESLEDPDWSPEDATILGVDVHAVDDRLYLGQFTCQR